MSRILWFMCRFQLILFDLIGKVGVSRLFKSLQSSLACFQLILFDLIGKDAQTAAYLGMQPSFQLILFDLIGKDG